MTKPKAEPRDYDEDMRFDPPPENATKRELWKRADNFVTETLLRPRKPQREPSKTK